jgi:hypothetical protein
VIKRTCEGCRALEYIRYGGATCTLGYSQVKEYEGDLLLNVKPGTPCPKPRTVSEYVKLTIERYEKGAR